MRTLSKIRQKKVDELVEQLGIAFSNDPSMDPGDIFAYLSSLTNSTELIDLAMSAWDGAQVEVGLRYAKPKQRRRR